MAGASIFADFIVANRVIGLTGFLMALVASVLFLATIRIPGILRSIVWLCIIVVFVLLAVGGYALLEEAKSQSGMSGEHSKE
jgi:heme A synthase